MRIPDETINQIIERLDIADLVGTYTPLSKKGNRYWGLCPFHSEKTPSFSVTPDKGIFYCFGCHKGGSALTFLMEIEKLSFPEAVELAARKTGVEIRRSGEGAGGQNREAHYELYRRVATTFSHFLLEHKKGDRARAYLAHRKIGIEVQRDFLLGYAPPERDWLHQFLKTKNYSDDFLAQSGFFVRDTQAYFHNRVMFPIMNPRGDIIAFGGRALDDYGPKYLNSPETAIFHKGTNLYGLYRALSEIKKTGECYLVEGYMDVIALHNAGVTNCVAPLGTALTDDQARLLKRYCGKINLLFDSDEAGTRATLKAIEIFEAFDIETKIVELEGKKDPAEIFEKEGAGELKKVLKYTINSFQYLLKRAFTQHDVSTPSGKEGVVAFIAPIVAKVQSQIRKDAYIDMAADALGVRPETVRHDLDRSRKPQGKTAEPEHKQGLAALSDELYFMLATAVTAGAFENVRRQVRLDDLEEEPAKELYIALEECFRNDWKTIEQLIPRLDNEHIRTILVEKASSDEFLANQEKLIADGIRMIRQKSLERKKADVIVKVRDCERQKADNAQIRELQLEVMYLDEELKKLKVREYGRNN